MTPDEKTRGNIKNGWRMQIMIRVLFVDDDPSVLSGLRRSLRSQRAEWDMDFASGGLAALQMMDAAPFDVIVSDMRMPGMDGAELLVELSRSHPESTRFILSGYADGGLIRKCMGSAHQYLSKPCDPEVLKLAITRAANLEARVKSASIRRLVSGMDLLPTVPAIYSELMERIQDPEAGIDEIGGVIARDVAMTATVLKLTNSAFFGLPQRIADPIEATSYLGIDTIKNLVLSLKVFEQFQEIKIPEFSVARLWHHSAAIASAARAISAFQGEKRNVCDQCFLAGLLHDVGTLVFVANCWTQYVEAVQLAKASNIDLTEAETRVFGASHADVGGFLLGLWGLPLSVVEAISLHHEPSRSDERVFGPLAVVHVAEMSAAVGSEAVTQTNDQTIDLDYLNEVGVADCLGQWVEVASEFLNTNRKN